MKPITDRIRVFLFGITVAFLGLINPARALQNAYQVLGDTTMNDLRTAAQQALDSINELFAAEQSEGGERGGHIRTPATREHLVRVAKARRALHESFVALRAALEQEQAEPMTPADRIEAEADRRGRALAAEMRAAMVPLTSDKDLQDQGSTFIDGYGYVDTRAVRAIEQAFSRKNK